MKGRYVTSTYETADAYKKLLLDVRNAKVRIEPSDDDTTKFVFFEKKRRPYEFFVQDGTLTVKPLKARWYHSLRIGIDRSQISLRVPKSILEAVSVRANVGQVDIRSIACHGPVTIRVNTGRVNLESVTCKRLDVKGNTASASLNTLAAEESVDVKCNTGRVLLNDISAPKILVKTNTGGVGGRLPSNTVFAVCTNTGKIELPEAPVGGAIGGRCEIKTNTGNIKFE